MVRLAADFALKMFAAYKNKNQLIGFIGSCQDGISLYVIDSISEETIWKKYYEKENAKNFMDKFATFSNFSQNIFKCFILELFERDWFQYICEDLKEKLHQFQIPYSCISHQNFLFSVLLASTKITSKFGDTVLFVLPFKTSLNIGEFKYTPKGYELIQKKFFAFDPKTKPEILRQKILGTSTPNKLIVAPHESKEFAYREVFGEMKFCVAHGCLDCHPEQFVIEECKRILDKNYVKYHILPTSIYSFNMFGSYGSENAKFELLKVDMDEPLPISKTAYVTKSVLEVLVDMKTVYESVTIKRAIGKDFHQDKITLTIDENNFYYIRDKKLRIGNLETFLSRIKILAELKIPFVGFVYDSSVVAVHKKSDGYKFLEEWNGQLGKEVFISFDKEKPQFGLDAIKAIKRKRSFVVFDLIKIMSMPPDSIEESPHWGFKITNDAENPVLLEFDTFSGKQMAATPEFLLAMVLDQQLKAIEKEIGKKPTKIAFRIFKEYNVEEEFDEDEMERIKAGIEKACELKKVECIFIDAPEYPSRLSQTKLFEEYENECNNSKKRHARVPPADTLSRYSILKWVIAGMLSSAAFYLIWTHSELVKFA